MKIVRAGIPVFLLLLPIWKAGSAENDWKPVGEPTRPAVPIPDLQWKPSGHSGPSGDPFQSAPTPPTAPALGLAPVVPPFPAMARFDTPAIAIRSVVSVVPSVAAAALPSGIATSVRRSEEVLVLEPVQLRIPDSLLPPAAPVDPPRKAIPAPILEVPREPSAGPAFVPKPPVIGGRKILPPEGGKPADKPLIRFPAIREVPSPKPGKVGSEKRDPTPEPPLPIRPTARPASSYGPIGESAPILPPESSSVPPLPPTSFGSSAIPAETPASGSNHLEMPFDAPRQSGSSLYARADYLMWWMSAPRVPLLATTGPLSTAGIVGRRGTLPLIGPRELDTSSRSGGRFALGWVPNGDLGVEGEFFFLAPETNSTAVGSPSFALISRPYFSQQNGETASIVAAPLLATGTLSVDSRNSIYGFNALLTKRAGEYAGFETTLLGGFRYLNFHEDLTITESIRTGPLALDPTNTRIGVRDSFSTRNEFYGAMLGLDTAQCFGRFDLRFRGSVSLGAIEQRQDIAGTFSRQAPGQLATTNARGLFATPANNGRYSRTEFGFVPEAGLTLGYHITQSVHVTAGYRVLYVDNVVRPGDNLDRVVDSSLISSPPPGVMAGTGTRPAPTFHETDLFLHGLTLGLELRW